MPLSPFEFVNDITNGKKDIMRGTDNDSQSEKDYDQFIVNRALSYFPDTVLYASEMNIRILDNRLCYTYLLHSIRPKKRFAKWEKHENPETIKMLRQFYGYSYQKAKDALKLLSDQQLEEIKELYNKGGKNVK